MSPLGKNCWVGPGRLTEQNEYRPVFRLSHSEITGPYDVRPSGASYKSKHIMFWKSARSQLKIEKPQGLSAILVSFTSEYINRIEKKILKHKVVLILIIYLDLLTIWQK